MRRQAMASLDHPLISVIVPIHDVEPYLRQCIESLINQTWERLEIILVDDGSTDGCPVLCDQYASMDTRVKVIHQANVGLIGARKAGLAIATGVFVGYVDGDDWVEPEMYESMLEHALDCNADVVVGGHKEDLLDHVEVLLNHIPTGIYTKDRLMSEIFPKMMFFGLFSQFGIFSYVWGKLYRKSVLYDNQMRVDEEIHIGEDAACLYPTLLDAEVVCVTDLSSYHYRQRVDSMIKTPKHDEAKSIFKLYNFLEAIFLRNDHSEVLIHQLRYFVLSLLIVRSDALPVDSLIPGSLVPFRNIAPGSRIAVCGAGTFGQHLYKRLLRQQSLLLIEWVDELYLFYRQLGLEVNPPESLSSLELDYVVIAFIDEAFSNAVKEKLIGLGVADRKILTVMSCGERVDYLLQRYGLTS